MKIDLSKNKNQAAFFDAVMQAVAGQSRNRFFAYGGAIRGGKTYVTLFILIVLARKFPGSRWHVIRKDLPSLKATTIPSFEKLVPPDVKIHRDPGNYRAEFPNGSQIFFKPESLNQDPELKDFLGLETNGIFLEQAEELSEKMHDRAKERTGSWYIDPMPPGFIFYTFNPTDEWVRDVFYEPHNRRDLKEPYYYREALPTDNPYVTADQWAAWDEMDDTVKAQMVLGDWDARRTDNQFYYGFSRAKHVGPVTIDPALPVHLSFDQNVLPYITLTCWQVQDISGIKTACQFDEFCLEHPKNTTEALCNAFMDKYGHTFTQAFIYGDASGNKRDTRANVTDYAIAKRVLRPLLNNRSDRTLKSNPNVVKRREWENNILNGKYAIGVLIDPGCKNSIADLVNTPTDENGHKLKKRVRGANGETFEKYGHTSDTMDYVLTTVFEREFVRYINNRFSISS